MNDESECTIEITGTKKTWRLRDGLLHRMNGPAVERTDGDRSWYINGVRIDVTAVQLHVGMTFHWSLDTPSLVVKQINHTLFQVILGNQKKYLFSTHNEQEDKQDE